MKKAQLISIAIAMLIASCEKDNNSLTKESLTGMYKNTALSAKFGPAPAVDFYAQYGECERDDFEKFNSDMSYDYVDEGFECTPSRSFTATWSLPSSSQMIIAGRTYQVRSFDGKALVIATDTIIGGYSAVLTYTYTKQ